MAAASYFIRSSSAVDHHSLHRDADATVRYLQSFSRRYASTDAAYATTAFPATPTPHAAGLHSHRGGGCIFIINLRIDGEDRNSGGGGAL